MGNFFVYIVRFAVLDWGPTMLKEHLHMDISHAGWTVAAFEIAGIAGMLAAGWATDRFFGGRAPRTCVICMLMTALCLVGLYTLNEHTPLAVAIAILMSAGFFIYGPQALVGIAAANIATKRAAATAGGFCGHIAPTIPSSEGLTTVFYLFVLVRLYMILRGIAAKGWGGRQYKYKDMVSVSQMRFRGRQTMRNMLVMTVLIPGTCLISFSTPMLGTGAMMDYNVQPVDYVYYFRAD